MVRTWELGHRAVVLGASGRLLEDVRVEACRLDGVVIARRSSGGGTVVIGPGSLNVTIVLPIAADPAFRAVDEAQLSLLGRLAQAIRAEGIPVEIRSSGDLTLGGRKFSGSAQRRLRDHLMVHASLLYDFPIDRIDRYTRNPRRQPDYREDRPHDEFLTNLPMVRNRLISALMAGWGASGPELVVDENTERLMRELLATKFTDFGWIGRL